MSPFSTRAELASIGVRSERPLERGRRLKRRLPRNAQLPSVIDPGGRGATVAAVPPRRGAPLKRCLPWGPLTRRSAHRDVGLAVTEARVVTLSSD
jgi:hypothetical protein